MQKSFSPEDVIKLALQIEQSGKTVYQTAAEQAQTPELTELFQFLAREENDHIDSFQKIYDDYKLSAKTLGVSKPEDMSYLETLAQSQLFQGADKAINAVKQFNDLLQLINFALGFERDAMLFFVKLYRMVGEKYRNLISKLIKEEEAHIVKLTEIQYKLINPKPDKEISGKE
ncbi:MAG: ferritin family protein [bacterium]